MPLSADSLKQQAVEQVPLDSVDSDRPLFPMSFEPDLATLRASLHAVGILHPVILRKAGSCFRLVTGYRRVLAARELGWSSIPGRVIPCPADTDAAAFSLAFYENCGTRSFNLVEASQVVNGFLDHTHHDEAFVRGTILPLMGFQPAKAILQQLRGLTNLIHAWKVLTIERTIALPHASIIGSYDHEDQELLYQHLAPLKLGHSTLRHCLEMIEEICRREVIPLKALLQAEPFAALRLSERCNAVQKTDRFRRLLKERRYPQFSQVEQTYQDERRKLSLPPEVQIHPPDFFEGNQLTVVFKFSSRPQLRAILSSLRSAGESEAIENILDML